MPSIITTIRNKTIGPRKVSSVVRTFGKAVSALQDTADYHNNASAEKRAEANRLQQAALTHDSDAAQALRVQSRIKAIIA